MKSIDYEEKKKNIKIASILVAIILVFLIGVTIAYFMIKKDIELDTITSGTLDMNMTFSDGSDEITLGKVTPIYKEDIETESSYIDFNIENIGTIDMYTEIYLKDISMSNELINSDFKWRIEDGSGNVINQGTFLNKNNDKLFLTSNVLIPSGNNNTKDFKIRIWVEENDKDQSIFDSKKFSAKVGATGYARKLSFSKIIIHNNEIKTTPTFSSTTKEDDKGLFKTEDENIYYFRDRVDNNYVQFGTKKDTDEPLIWRIIRTGENNSVKLILNESITNEEIRWTLENQDYEDTNIPDMLDNWYNDNLKNNDSLILDSKYCTQSKYSSSTITFDCVDGKEITKKVGLISGSEAENSMFSHYSYGRSYLEDGGSFWSTGGYYFLNNGFELQISGEAGQGYAYGGIRPVITLSPKIDIIKGMGDFSNPYVVKEAN